MACLRALVVARDIACDSLRFFGAQQRVDACLPATLTGHQTGRVEQAGVRPAVMIRTCVRFPRPSLVRTRRRGPSHLTPYRDLGSGRYARRAVPSILVLRPGFHRRGQPGPEVARERHRAPKGLKRSVPPNASKWRFSGATGSSSHAFGRAGTSLGPAGGWPPFFQAPPRSGGGSDDIGDAAVAAGRRRGVEGVAEPKPSTILRPKGL